MGIHHRVAGVVATEGIKGLFRRGVRKLLRRSPAETTLLVKAPLPPPDTDKAAHVAAYAAQVSEFREQVRRRQLRDVEHFYWYHTIDLGDGLVTPGDFDLRPNLGDYHFPESMKGMTVLDVGSATGFFAFEFERRGANVVSVELPSVADWDMIWSEREAILNGFKEEFHCSTVEESHWRHLEGPFQFCRKMLGSKVKRCLSRIYDLTPARLGVEKFDLVFLGDILQHIFSPLQALNAIAPLCQGRVILASVLPHQVIEAPGMLYIGQERPPEDDRSWFLPNEMCYRQMFRRLGFSEVRIYPPSRNLFRRHATWIERQVIHAIM